MASNFRFDSTETTWDSDFFVFSGDDIPIPSIYTRDPTRAGADGCVTSAPILGDDCCPPSLCIDFCALACSFISLLPSGPIWDRSKAEALDYYRNNRGTDPCDYACAPDELSCQSLVSYGVYLARVLHDLIYNALHPSLRESNPATAVTTIDDWLLRLGWQDCFATVCRDNLLTNLAPYEVLGIDGLPVACPVAIPNELQCAVKRGIIKSLNRSGMGGIKNLCWLNWVVEPLGAKLTPRNRPEIPGTEFPHCDCLPPEGAQFTLSHFANTLPACETDLTLCGGGNQIKVVSASVGFTLCDTSEQRTIWPGVLAAECILRSLLPVACPINIFRET